MVLVSTGEEMELFEIEDMLVVGGIVVMECCLPSFMTLDQGFESHDSFLLFLCLKGPSEVVSTVLV